MKEPEDLFNRMLSGFEWYGFTTNCITRYIFKFLVDGLYKITNIRIRAYSVSWNINGRNRKTEGEHQ